MKKFLALFVTVAILAGSLVGAIPAGAVDTSRYFPETSHLVQGPFLDFWSNNGGLPIFGYPISSEFDENGMKVQYFERAVFEYHADVTDPAWKVQLRNVGSLATAGMQFPAIQPFESTDTAWYFPETGHAAAYGFLDYWKSHGALHVFGFPISEEFSEVNPIDGQTYTVQYYERARFEYHPEFKGTPYEVELGHLGVQDANLNAIPDQVRAPEQADPSQPGGQVSGGSGIVTLGWWGTINSPTVNARSNPDSNSTLVGYYSQGMVVKVLAEAQGQEVVPGNNVWYQLDGGRYKGAWVYSIFVTKMDQPSPDPTIQVPAGVGPNEVWVDVNLSKYVLTLMQGNQPIFVTYVAIGTPVNPTVVGQFRVWIKLQKTTMAGRPPVVAHSYDLPDVPWVQYFYGGFALHGTYWHDNFMSQRSAGCVNLTIGDAQYIFGKTHPVVPPDVPSKYPTTSDPGTVVVTHW
jgi:hypothetical protein